MYLDSNCGISEVVGLVFGLKLQIVVVVMFQVLIRYSKAVFLNTAND